MDDGAEIKERKGPHPFLRTIYFSYEISQGDQPFQQDLLKYILKKHPELMPQDSDWGAIYETLVSRITKRMDSKRPNHDTVDTDRHVGSDLSDTITVLRSYEDSDDEPIGLDEIVGQIIKHDDFYVNRGRVQRYHSSLDTRTSERLSQLHFFAGLGEPVGTPEFDELFQDIRIYISEKIKSGEWSEDILRRLYDEAVYHSIGYDPNRLKRYSGTYTDTQLLGQTTEEALAELMVGWEKYHDPAVFGKFLDPFKIEESTDKD